MERKLAVKPGVLRKPRALSCNDRSSLSLLWFLTNRRRVAVSAFSCGGFTNRRRVSQVCLCIQLRVGCAFQNNK